MSLTRSVDDILKAVEAQHAEYIKQLRLLHEATARNTGAVSPTSARMERSGSGDVPSAPSPALKAISFSSDTLLAQSANPKRPRRFTNDSPEPSYLAAFSPSDNKKTRPSSTYDGMAPESGDDLYEFLPLTSPSRQASAKIPPEAYMSYVVEPIDRENFSEHALASHLASLDDTCPETTITALGDIWNTRAEINASAILNCFDTVEDGPYIGATYEVYEVGRDGKSHPKHSNNGDQEGEALEALTVWETLKKVNSGGSSVGRMTILQEPSPLMLGAAHMTMGRHFDMNELFQHLVSTNGNKGKTRAYMSRAFESDPLRQRTFFFAFKYYTVVGEGFTPVSWQAYDPRPQDRKSPDHIDITECSSILALSLGMGSKPPKPVRPKVRRRGVANKQGLLYDTFAPWHLLSIQCFPDDEHSMRSEDSEKPFFNGPYAFLDSLSVEYRDAVKRYAIINEMITKLITPPHSFMFDAKLRDKLLFEDKDFTYSRRYFWAYNTLGVINDGIKSMRNAYLDTFTKDFWAGRHKTLWPHPDPDSAEGRDYIVRMEGPRHELETAIRDLSDVYDKNERTRTEIRSLREQLFSGSSVKESRRAIEQGDNIKILTAVSMIFLPLTFVTSVFGITTFVIGADDWQFPVTMVSVCIPFFLLITILQTQTAMIAVRKASVATGKYFKRLYGRAKSVVSPPGPGSGPGGNTDQGVDGRGRAKRFRRVRRARGLVAVGVGGGGLKRTQSGLHMQHGVGGGDRKMWWRFGADKTRAWWPRGGWKKEETARSEKDEIV